MHRGAGVVTGGANCTAPASSDALAAKGRPLFVPKCFQGGCTCVVCARDVSEAGRKDTIDDRPAKFVASGVGALEHIGKAPPAGGRELFRQLVNGGARQAASDARLTVIARRRGLMRQGSCALFPAMVAINTSGSATAPSRMPCTSSSAPFTLSEAEAKALASEAPTEAEGSSEAPSEEAPSEEEEGRAH
jgi:hypothetical protein